MIRFGMSKLCAMLLAVGLVAMVAAPAQARERGGRRGGSCHGGCYGGGYGCCGGGYYGGGCWGGGYYGGGCCGGGWYGGGYGSGTGSGAGRGSYYYSEPYGYYAYGSMPYSSMYGRSSFYYAPGQQGNGGSPATIQIRVPGNAELWFDDYRTRQTGETRVFQTPPLNGDNASYTLRARWMDKDGKPVEQTKQVQVQGGKEVEVDFNETVPLPKGSK